jgi:hypothetical protein
MIVLEILDVLGVTVLMWVTQVYVMLLSVAVMLLGLRQPPVQIIVRINSIVQLVKMQDVFGVTIPNIENLLVLPVVILIHFIVKP